MREAKTGRTNRMQRTPRQRSGFTPGLTGAGSLIRVVGRNDMLCEICHEREATVHNTEIAVDVQKTRDLCEQCFQATEPARAGD